MSHIISIETEIRDEAALIAACKRLKLSEPKHETVQLFSGDATGHVVRLSDWKYPIVFDLNSGEIAFDNFGGRWGE